MKTLAILMAVTAPQPAPAPPAPAAECAGAAAERAELEAGRAAAKVAIADIATGRRRTKRKVGAGDVGRAVAGTAASVLLPFGIGALVSAGASAVGGKGKKTQTPVEPEADVPALIARQQAIEARLAELSTC
jgi:hypothetical protein